MMSTSSNVVCLLLVQVGMWVDEDWTVEAIHKKPSHMRVR
jgi:hypothetical protein